MAGSTGTVPVYEVVGLISAAIIAAALLCWVAVSLAVHRVRQTRARRNGRAGKAGV